MASIGLPSADIGGGRTIEKPVGIKEVGAFLGRSESHIYILMEKKQIPYHQMGGRRYFYLTEVDKALRAM